MPCFLPRLTEQLLKTLRIGQSCGHPSPVASYAPCCRWCSGLWRSAECRSKCTISPEPVLSQACWGWISRLLEPVASHAYIPSPVPDPGHCPFSCPAPRSFSCPALVVYLWQSRPKLFTCFKTRDMTRDDILLTGVGMKSIPYWAILGGSLSWFPNLHSRSEYYFVWSIL